MLQRRGLLIRSKNRLRQVREGLLRQFDAISSAADVLDFQLALIKEIEAAELAVAAERESPEYLHRHLVRRLGDAVAWLCLHPYAIRQLYLGAAAPPSISRQDGFSLTLEAADVVTRKGIPALISDVTYCLGTGDVVVADNPERPSLIECGSRRFAATPRKRRQEQRSRAALTQLRDGLAQWPDRSRPTVTREVSSNPRRHVFDAVGDVLRTASKGKPAVKRVGDQQVVFGIRADGEWDDEVLDEVADGMGKPAFFVTSPHERRPNPRLAPPYMWPLGAKERILVAEADVVVGQAVDLVALEGASCGNARLLKVEMRGGEIFVTAERGSTAFVMTPGPLLEAVGNYESLDSMISVLIGALVDVGLELHEDGLAPSDTVPDEWGIPKDLVEAVRERAEQPGNE